MSTMTISPSMPMRAIKLDRNLLLTLAVAVLGLLLAALMLSLSDPQAVAAALSVMG